MVFLKLNLEKAVQTIIPLSETSLNENSMPFSVKTWRKWYHLRRFPGVIFKLAGRLFINLDEWEIMVQKSTEASISLSDRNRKIGI